MGLYTIYSFILLQNLQVYYIYQFSGSNSVFLSLFPPALPQFPVYLLPPPLCIFHIFLVLNNIILCLLMFIAIF